MTLLLPARCPLPLDTVVHSDALTFLRGLPDNMVNCIVTSPPYFGLRDYGVAGQMGLEESPAVFVAKLVELFREARRVLRSDGTCWVNLGDSYWTDTYIKGAPPQGYWKTDGMAHREGGGFGHRPEGLRPKNLLGIPWRVAFGLQDDGWILRSDVIWHKPNPMPESVQGSHFSRHRVTIEEYEKLSGLPYTEQRNDQDGAADLSGLPSGKGAPSQAPLSAQREGQSNGAGKGTTRGRKGKTETTEPLTTGAQEQSEVRGDGKGQGDTAEGVSQIQNERAWQRDGGGAASEKQRPSIAHRAAPPSEFEVYANGEMEGEEIQGLRPPEGGHRTIAASDGRGLVGDNPATQPPLLLLQEAPDFDDRSRNTSEQGRAAREGEYRASLQELQFEEEGQDNSTRLVDCPGCPKCEKFGGYILHMSAGRPTKSHEYVFLLAKNERYWYDTDAIREPHLRDWSNETMGGALKPGSKWTVDAATPTSHVRTTNPPQLNTAGRNKRTVWTVATQPFEGAHFATFPQKLIEPMILAGCPHKVCAVCGAPWVRRVEVSGGSIGESWHDHSDDLAQGQRVTLKSAKGRVGSAKDENGNSYPRTDLGFSPTCTHTDAPTRPGIVLDPFMGSGTTGLVARHLGRRYMGCDISAEYVMMARERLAQPYTLPMFESIGVSA